jgi:hypothetical protein
MLNAFDYYDNDNSSNCQENSKSEIPVKYYPLYGDNTFDPDRIGKGYQDFFDSLKINKKKSIEKELLRQRIAWLTPESEKEISSYLEHNAQIGGIIYMMNITIKNRSLTVVARTWFGSKVLKMAAIMLKWLNVESLGVRLVGVKMERFTKETPFNT